ncbi:DUF6515 family protein [Coraliomargarita algicola]|uniref:DUF6515 family protein n=1 Tax=Coraliomargarita algicola TaxID=3092156 RepID=A0ABZ0RLT6_9BACT|nr:DUF6515 family protein [Coraliomargarita sp. J2-16]WPJ97052.1 DUF6515 family protein [Coraliomargarita sp. J2-16]
MKHKNVQKALLLSLILAPISTTILAAKPPSPAPAKHASHGPSIGAFIGIQPPAGAVEVKVGGFSFRYRSGVFYKHTKHGYVVTKAPRGAVVHSLPPGHSRRVINGYTYYCHGDVYYRKAPNGYIVVEAPVVVQNGPVVVNSAVPVPGTVELSVWQGEQELLIREGAFFKNTPEGLVWVEQPIGALTKSLPEDATSIWYQDIEYLDVDGILFRKTPDGYKVVEAPWESAK